MPLDNVCGRERIIYMDKQATGKKSSNLIKNNKGMTMVSILMAAGMMGGLALFLSDLMKKQHVEQKKSETGVAMTALQQTVLSIFNDGGACTETLKGMSTTGIPSSGTTLSAGLKNRSGTVVVNAGKVNNLLDVKFTLKNPNIPSGTGIRSGNVDVEMEVRKLSNVVVLRKTVKETIPLIVEVDGTNKIVNCRTTLDSKALNIKMAAKREAKGEAKQEICTGLGAIWNTSTSSCSISNLFQKQCQDVGGIWGGSPAKCSIRNLFQKQCQDFGGIWGGSPAKCSISNLFQKQCQDFGGIWGGSPPKCSISNLFQKQCQDSGGTWGGSPAKCSNRRQEVCQDLGGTWSGSGCSIRNVLQTLRSDITALQTGKANTGHSHNYAAIGHTHSSGIVNPGGSCPSGWIVGPSTCASRCSSGHGMIPTGNEQQFVNGQWCCGPGSCLFSP